MDSLFLGNKIHRGKLFSGLNLIFIFCWWLVFCRSYQCHLLVKSLSWLSLPLDRQEMPNRSHRRLSRTLKKGTLYISGIYVDCTLFYLYLLSQDRSKFLLMQPNLSLITNARHQCPTNKCDNEEHFKHFFKVFNYLVMCFLFFLMKMSNSQG